MIWVKLQIGNTNLMPYVTIAYWSLPRTPAHAIPNQGDLEITKRWVKPFPGFLLSRQFACRLFPSPSSLFKGVRGLLFWPSGMCWRSSFGQAVYSLNSLAISNWPGFAWIPRIRAKFLKQEYGITPTFPTILEIQPLVGLLFVCRSMCWLGDHFQPNDHILFSSPRIRCSSLGKEFIRY